MASTPTNVVVREEDGKLIIEIDLSQDNGPSSTGNTRIIASSRGNQPMQTDTAGRIYYALNVFKYPQRERRERNDDDRRWT